MHKNDILALLTMLVGIGSLATDAAFGTELNSLVGPLAPKVLAGIGLVAALASQVIRVLNAPAQTKGTQ